MLDGWPKYQLPQPDLMESAVTTIAEMFRQRWQIELFFN
jgi:hypothetical protein